MEFKRCGYLWEPLKHNIIDAGTLFKKREARGLAAAYKFYCGKEHIDAHSAAIDSAVTAEVLVSQLERYGLKDYPLPLVEAESLFQKPLDVAGKIVLNDKGEPVYAFGKVKGVRVEDDLGFAQWMRSKDFHPDTIRVLDEIRTAL
jgi:DNA polymerase-3 subunit epsilon